MGCWSPRGRGYAACRLEPGQVDVDRFEALVAEGRARAASTVMREPRRAVCARRWRCGAVRRWRTSPTSRSRKRRSRGLEEARLAALEDRIDADLALGRARAAGGRARGARARASVARAPSGPADARAVPLRAPGRRAGGLPGRAASSCSTSSDSSPGARCRSSSERSWPKTRRWSRPPGSTRRRAARDRSRGRRGAVADRGRGSGPAGGDRRGRGEAGGLRREHRPRWRRTRSRRSTFAATASSAAVAGWCSTRRDRVRFGVAVGRQPRRSDDLARRSEQSADAAQRSRLASSADWSRRERRWCVGGRVECPIRPTSSVLGRPRSTPSSTYVWRRRADRQRRPERAGGGRGARQLGLGRALDGPADAPGRASPESPRSSSIRTPARPGSRSATGRSGSPTPRPTT